MLSRDGELMANVLAPRVRNVGHWSIEGAETSQFENHMRAVLGRPLGATTMRGHACMLNWIGELPDADAVLQVAGGHRHEYGKSPRRGRKVGQATMRCDPATEPVEVPPPGCQAPGRQDTVAPGRGAPGGR